jgi:hypothetical protein
MVAETTVNPRTQTTRVAAMASIALDIERRRSQKGHRHVQRGRAAAIHPGLRWRRCGEVMVEGVEVILDHPGKVVWDFVLDDGKLLQVVEYEFALYVYTNRPLESV